MRSYGSCATVKLGPEGQPIWPDRAESTQLPSPERPHSYKELTPPGTGEIALRMAGIQAADLLGDRPVWQQSALCSQTDPEAFFPEKGASYREAQRICSLCEVRAECEEYALQTDEGFGIWAGLTRNERKRLKRRAA